MSNKLILKMGKLWFAGKNKVLPSKIDKILISKIGAIGDVIMTTPLVSAVREKYPDAKIDYLVGNWSKAVLNNNKDINEVISFKDEIFHKKQYKELKKLSKEIKEKKYDLIINLDKSWMNAVFCSKCGKFRVGFDRFGEGFANNLNVPYGNDKHEIDYYLDVAKLLGCTELNKETKIELSKEDIEFVDALFKEHQLGKKTIAFVPGGANNLGVGLDRIRRLPEMTVMQVLDWLGKDYDFVLVGGPSDKEYYDELLKKLKPENKVINLAGKTSITQSVAVFKKVSAVICNDSGPMHMAASVNKNIVALFGPTMPSRKGPLHKESISIWNDQDIYDPNYEIYGTAPKSQDFMIRITGAEIVNAVKKLIS